MALQTGTGRVRPADREAERGPWTAVLSDSVPPEVNTTSPGRQPTTSASASRASSTARRAWRAKRCVPDGFPNRSGSPPSQGSMAWRASGRIGVVAAWSR